MTLFLSSNVNLLYSKHSKRMKHKTTRLWCFFRVSMLEFFMLWSESRTIICAIIFKIWEKSERAIKSATIFKIWEKTKSERLKARLYSKVKEERAIKRATMFKIWKKSERHFLNETFMCMRRRQINKSTDQKTTTRLLNAR
jgi:hypothetical protein